MEIVKNVEINRNIELVLYMLGHDFAYPHKCGLTIFN